MKIGAEIVANDTARVEGTTQQDEDDTMADSENYKQEVGSMGLLSSNGVEESFACERDPLALNLGHDSNVKAGGPYSNSQCNTDTWSRPADRGIRGVAEQIPDHLLSEMQE